jgi:hypothetical protein
LPIQYHIDTERSLVAARANGVLTDADIFGYQREVWSRPEVAGFDELVDMTAVEQIDLPSQDRVRDLALISAAMDNPSRPARFAIVAPGRLAYGLGRMYQAYREMDEHSHKTVGVFRTLPEAWAYLGLPGDPPALD